MEFQLFLKPTLVLMSLISGFIFGFLLQKATVSRFDTIVGQLLLKDFTVMKVILTAIVVGSIGIYSLSSIGIIPTLHLSKTPILFSLLGGSIFGMGMSLSGYCPGTAIAAIADGSKDMIFGALGMFFGSILFNELSSTLLPYMAQKDGLFQKTIGDFFSVPNWIIIVCLSLGWMTFVIGMKKLENKRKFILQNR